MLTVQQLIDQLQQVKDKSVQVVFDEGGAFYELNNVVDMSVNCGVVELAGEKVS